MIDNVKTKLFGYKNTRFSPHRHSDFIVRNIIKNLKINSIIDICCGDASLAKYFNKKNLSYLGLDCAAECYPKEEHPNIIYHKPSEYSFDFVKRNVVCILLLDVLEHINNFDIFLKDAFKNSNKYVVVCLPNEYVWFNRLKFLLGKELSSHGFQTYGQKEGHRHQWLVHPDSSRKVLTKIAKELNFELSEINMLELFPGKNWKYFLYVCLRRILPQKSRFTEFIYIFKNKKWI